MRFTVVVRQCADCGWFALMIWTLTRISCCLVGMNIIMFYSQYLCVCVICTMIFLKHSFIAKSFYQHIYQESNQNWLEIIRRSRPAFWNKRSCSNPEFIIKWSLKCWSQFQTLLPCVEELRIGRLSNSKSSDICVTFGEDVCIATKESEKYRITPILWWRYKMGNYSLKVQHQEMQK